MNDYILIVSDSHFENETLLELTNRYKDVPLKFHCGDSNLNASDQLLEQYHVVCGNHDDVEQFAHFICIKPFLITHGHLEKVYLTDQKLIELAKENDCSIVFHGHTHIPRDTYVNGIHIMNPGSILINRGSYGYATYALYHIPSDTIRFYRTSDHQDVTDEVLNDGIKLLNEIRSEL